MIKDFDATNKTEADEQAEKTSDFGDERDKRNLFVIGDLRGVRFSHKNVKYGGVFFRVFVNQVLQRLSNRRVRKKVRDIDIFLSF